MQEAGKRHMALNTFKHLQLKKDWEAGVCRLACNTFCIIHKNISQEYYQESDRPGDEEARQNAGRGFKE